MKTRRILISAGGSGGHFFPALAIADEIQNLSSSTRIEFVGTTAGIEYRVLKLTDKFPIHIIPVCKFYRIKRSLQILNGFKLVWAVCKSLFIIIRFNPNIVLGSGGFVSAPVMAAAVILRKKTVIQEQNVSPGMVNRIFSKYADLCLLAHKPLEKNTLFKRYEIIGNPIRKEIDSLSEESVPLSLNPVHICLVGGSQGAGILNKTLTDSLPMLEKYKDFIRITHQTGKHDFEYVQKKYQLFNISHTVVQFVDDMRSLYLNATLMISRSGSIVTEYLAAGRPSILIPITQSSGNHQKANAEFLVQNHAAHMIPEKDLSPEVLMETVENLVKNTKRLEEMAANARKLYKPHSAKLAANILLDRFLN